LNSLTFRITESDIEHYADVSGDHNPIHLDREEANRNGFTNKIAHGMLTIAKVWSVLSQAHLSPQDMPNQYEFTFLSPVHVGDQITLIVSQTKQEYRIEGKCKEKTVVRGFFSLISPL
jgi:3-hydroxybutyryl-CoA dehydratase